VHEWKKKVSLSTRYRAKRGFIAREAITPARILDESRYPLKNA
jgi:hypothetical protein